MQIQSFNSTPAYQFQKMAARTNLQNAVGLQADTVTFGSGKKTNSEAVPFKSDTTWSSKIADGCTKKK